MAAPQYTAPGFARPSRPIKVLPLSSGRTRKRGGRRAARRQERSIIAKRRLDGASGRWEPLSDEQGGLKAAIATIDLFRELNQRLIHGSEGSLARHCPQLTELLGLGLKIDRDGSKKSQGRDRADEEPTQTKGEPSREASRSELRAEIGRQPRNFVSGRMLRRSEGLRRALGPHEAAATPRRPVHDPHDALGNFVTFHAP